MPTQRDGYFYLLLCLSGLSHNLMHDGNRQLCRCDTGIRGRWHPQKELCAVQAVVIKRQLESQRIKTGAVVAVQAKAASGNSFIWKSILAIVVLVLSAEPLLANRW